METNNFPDRIYLSRDVEYPQVPDVWWEREPSEDNVEYIRTDTFIEKAENFISRKICDYIVHYNYGPNNDMETMYVDSRFFDDFKNYIKGE